jgi:hypothetical protein
MTCGGDEGCGSFIRFLFHKLEEKMPKQKLKLTKTEDQEYRARLLRLEEIGIPIGSGCHPSPEPDRFTLEQIEDYSAWICVLPSGMVAIVALAKVTVRISGVLITDVAMRIPDIDCQLDLSDPMESKYYPDLIDLLPYNRTVVLNDWLTSGVPLRCCQVQGAIIAEGWTSVPPTWHDETLVAVELLLRDKERKEFHFDFRARVNRSLQRKYERRQQERREVLRSTKREGLYGARRGQPGDQETVSPEEAINLRHASHERDAELQKPS